MSDYVLGRAIFAPLTEEQVKAQRESWARSCVQDAGPGAPVGVRARTSSSAVRILYQNWRGETAVRRIVPGPMWFGSTEWHPEPQWLMTADEPDTGKRRDFAMSGIKAWGDEAILEARHGIPSDNPNAPTA